MKKTRPRGAGTGAVAAGHPLTADAAAEILLAGGNAFDAALGAMCTATVSEPVLASLGGGGFLLARTAGGDVRLFDFFAQTPARGPDSARRDFYPIVADFGAAQQEFHIGLGSMAVPGAIDGLFHVHQALGRMPLARLVEPALAVAREGYELTPFQGYLFSVVGPIYMVNEGARRVFASPRDPSRLIGEGDHFKNPETADFLEELVREGPRLFYEGEIAQRIDKDCREGGGTLSLEDLGSYQTIERAPLSVDFADWRILTNPPPSTGGVLIAFALKLLEGSDALADGWGTPDHAMAVARAMALVGDARSAAPPGDIDRLLDPSVLSEYRGAVAGHPQMRRGTTHISVVDGEGNACSLTLSNGEGAGYVLPGTGVMMNNMLGEEDINPGGFDAWPPAVRMGSMMAPTIVERDGQLMVLGSGGSNRIRTAVMQVILNLTVFGMSAEQAVKAPRIHIERDFLDIEPGWPEEALAVLPSAAAAHRVWPERNLFFGGVHTVLSGDRSLEAAGDPRRAGATRIVGG